jgi:hypothetical protein
MDVGVTGLKQREKQVEGGSGRGCFVERMEVCTYESSKYISVLGRELYFAYQR